MQQGEIKKVKRWSIFLWDFIKIAKPHLSLGFWNPFLMFPISKIGSFIVEDEWEQYRDHCSYLTSLYSARNVISDVYTFLRILEIQNLLSQSCSIRYASIRELNISSRYSMAKAAMKLDNFSKAKRFSWYYSCDAGDWGFLIAKNMRFLSGITANFLNLRFFQRGAAPVIFSVC